MAPSIPTLPHPPAYPSLEEFAILPLPMQLRTLYLTQLAQLQERASVIQWAKAAVAASPVFGGLVAFLVSTLNRGG